MMAMLTKSIDVRIMSLVKQATMTVMMVPARSTSVPMLIQILMPKIAPMPNAIPIPKTQLKPMLMLWKHCSCLQVHGNA